MFVCFFQGPKIQPICPCIMYYTVFVFILYNTSLYFSPAPGRLAPNINRYHLLTNYHASRHGLRHTGRRRRRASPWCLRCWEARCFSRIRRGNQNRQQEPICERINSEFAFVKDRRRNRLAHSKANKLVGLFHNLRLLKRMRQVTYAEPAIAWTDDLEQSSVTKFEPAAIGSTSALVPRLWALVPSRLTPRVWSQTAARPFRSSISIPRHFSHAGFRGFIIIQIHNKFPNYAYSLLSYCIPYK